MDPKTDQQLLADYAGKRSEAAFAELVRRHIDLVYSAAFRMVGDSHRAKDVTQAVFVALAQNAKRLVDHPVLSGWLHRTTRNLSANTIRTEVRRQNHEQEAVAMNELLASGPDASWDRIAAHLDAGLDGIEPADRDLLLLCYFERKSSREISQRLGISEDAVRKRASRAVEKLRVFFSKQNVTIGAGGLVVLISANAVQSAPAGLSAAILTTTAGTTKALGLTVIHKLAVGALTAIVAGTGLYTIHLQNRAASLRQQQAELTQQIQQLSRERDDTQNQLATAEKENEKLSANTELLKLRGEVARLRSQQTLSAAATNLTSLTLKVDPEIFTNNVMTFASKTMHLPSDTWYDILMEIFDIERIPHPAFAYTFREHTIRMENTPAALKIFQKVVEALNQPDGKNFSLNVDPGHSVTLRSALYKMKPSEFEQFNLDVPTDGISQEGKNAWMLDPKTFAAFKQRVQDLGFKPFQSANVATYYGGRADLFIGDPNGKNLRFDFLPLAPDKYPYSDDLLRFDILVRTAGEFGGDPATEWPDYQGRTNCAVFASAIGQNGGGVVFCSPHVTEVETNDLVILSGITIGPASASRPQP